MRQAVASLFEAITLPAACNAALPRVAPLRERVLSAR